MTTNDKWTKFWDMNSGGGMKLEWKLIFIEAPEEEATAVFYARFGRNPNRVTCTCCGADYSISDEETLEEATEFHRSGKYNTHGGLTMAEFAAKDDVKIIYAKDITDEERRTSVPTEGYVWA